MAILVVNAGSSSLKMQVFEEDGLRSLHQIHWQGLTEAPGFDHLRRWTKILAENGCPPITAIGHRVVHGGTAYAAPVRLTLDVLRDLADLIPLAPLHQLPALRLVEAASLLFRDIPQVACFDTAFHRGRPAEADRFAIPEALHDSGIRKYGFHGLSYESVLAALRTVDPALADRRLVICHLGAGCSVAATCQGRPVDSSMGMSTFHGLPMATRSGTIDAGIVLHLMRQGWTADRIDRMLQKESGLLALSGYTGDMQALVGTDDPRGAKAVEYFCTAVAKAVAEMVVALGGLEGLVFTGGIGEHAPAVRRMIARRLGFLGVLLHESANERNTLAIGSEWSAVPVLVIPADEERMIARHVARVLEGASTDA